MAGEKGYWRSLYLRFDKESGERMEAEAAEALEKAGVSAAEQFEQTMQAGGRKAANTLARNLRDQFNTTIAQAKVNLARGLIDPKQFREIENAAKRTFNEGILSGMDRLRTEGKTSEAQLQRLARQLKEVGREGRDGTEEARGGLERLRKFALSAAGAVASIFAVQRIKDFVAGMFNLGSEVAAVEAQFGTVFGTLTDGIEASMEDWRRIAGITVTEMRRLLAATGSMAQGFGMSREGAADFSAEVIRLAGDLASFSGGVYTTEQAAGLLRSAIIGNTEAARSLMVNFTALDVTNRALAMTGKTSAAALTQQERAMAALAVITERAGPQIGDLARQQTEADNRARILAARFRSMREDLALSLIPTFEKLFDALDRSDAIEKIAAAAKVLAENMGEVVHFVGALTKALLIGGGIAAVVRLGAAIRAATAATTAWRGAMAGAQVLMGPTGWFVLGVAALTTAFQRQGRAARQAKQEVSDYFASLSTMSKDELDAEIEALAAQRKQIEAQMGRASSAGVRAQLKEQLDEIRAAGLEAIRLRNEMMREQGTPVPTPEGPTAAEKKAAEERIKKLWAHLETWRRSQQGFDAVTTMATYGAEEGVPLTEEGKKRFEEEQRRRRQALEQGLVLDKVAVRSALAEWDTLTRAQIDFLTNLESVADQVAYNIAAAFQSTFQLMHKEAATVGTFLEGMLRGLSGAVLASISQLAQGKVKENIAAAIEAGARALGFLAIGNFPSQGAALASAGQHLAAAAAWGALAGGAGAASGGVTGGRGAVPVATRDAGLSTAKGAQQRGPEVHIYIDPLDPSRPAYQRNVYAAQQMAKERYGEDANVVIHPHAGGGR